MSTSGGASYVYDGDGNRVKKTEGGQTILYVNKYYEKNITTSIVTTNYYLGDRLIATRENTTLTYVHQDSLNSTSVTTNSSGASTGTIKFFSFGSTRSGTVTTAQKFTGQRLDSTGLYYYGARYYDPSIGRFISPDTITQDPMNPQCFNRYSYTFNNPLKYTDPSGHLVNDSDDPTISAAWSLFCDTAPDIAKIMEEDKNITFSFKWGDNMGNMGGYTSDVKDDQCTIYLNPNKQNDIDDTTTTIAHESVHCIGNTFDQNNKIDDSIYEEMIAFNFQFWFQRGINNYSNIGLAGSARKFDLGDISDIGSDSLENKLLDNRVGYMYHQYGFSAIPKYHQFEPKTVTNYFTNLGNTFLNEKYSTNDLWDWCLMTWNYGFYNWFGNE